MKSVTLVRAVFRRLVTASCVCALLHAAATASAQVSFYTVVDQALRNSHQVRIAEADVRKSEGALRELKDAYIPSLSVGSGLGYSFGFTVNPPTLYNVTSQSLLFSFSQRDYMRAARAGLHGAQMHLSDQRQQVILDAAESYIELDALQQSLTALHDEDKYSERLTGIINDRFAAGLESRVAVTQTRLDAARVNLKQVQMRNRVSELQDHLSRLTALPPDTIRTDTASIPATPGLKPGQRVTGTTPALEAAFDNARAKQYQAFGVKREQYRPQALFAAQYNRYSTLTNFQDNFKTFAPNNFGIGVNINWPLIDETRGARRVQADADALHAQNEFLQARDQSAEGVLKLQNSFEQIAAQQQVAVLAAELAKDKLDAILTQASSHASGQSPLTPKDEQTARIEERERYLEVLEAQLSLAKIQLELLRATGGIEPWAKTAISTVSGQPAP